MKLLAIEENRRAVSHFTRFFDVERFNALFLIFIFRTEIVLYGKFTTTYFALGVAEPQRHPGAP